MVRGLTSFRAFAFFAVFLFHVGGLGAGYLGVQAFFVLSSFLLTGILMDMKSSLATKDYFVHFYGRRALRIFPLYYFYLAVVAILCLIIITRAGYNGTEQIDRFIGQLPWAATYSYDFFQASKFFQQTPLLSHFWSLAVEEQFYLFWPLAILLIPGKHLKRFLLFLIALGPLLRLSTAVLYPLNIFPFLQNNMDLVIYSLPFSQIDAFAIGGFFSLFGISGSNKKIWLLFFLAVGAGLLTSWLSTGDILWKALGYKAYMKDSLKYIWGYSLINLLFGWMLVNIRDRKFIPAVFENRILFYFGNISYGLYVYHLPIIFTVSRILAGAPKYVLVPVDLLLTILVSTASYELLEKRFINLKDKYFSRASARKPVPSAGSPN